MPRSLGHTRIKVQAIWDIREQDITALGQHFVDLKCMLHQTITEAEVFYLTTLIVGAVPLVLVACSTLLWFLIYLACTKYPRLAVPKKHLFNDGGHNLSKAKDT